MKIQREEISNKKVIISLAGEIDLNNYQKLRKELSNLCEEEYNKIIVDFTEVKGIHNMGVSQLLVFQKKMKDKDCKVIIKNLKNENVKDKFKAMNLDKVICIEY